LPRQPRRERTAGSRFRERWVRGARAMKAGKRARVMGAAEWTRLGIIGLVLAVVASLVVVYGS